MTADATVNGQTLQDLFHVTQEQLAARMDPNTLMRGLREDRQQFSGWLAENRWPYLSDSIASHACDFFRENVAGIFAGAWSKYAELRKCARETYSAPQSTAEVVLAEHEFNYEVEPAVEIRLNNTPVAEITFTLGIAFKVSAIALELKKGCVETVRTGKFGCSGEMRCGGVPVWSAQCPDLDLRGELKLKHPLWLLEGEPGVAPPPVHG